MVGLLAQLPPWPPSLSFSPSFLLRLPRKLEDFTAAVSWAPAGPYDLLLAFFPLPQSHSLFSPSLQQSLSSGSSCVAQRKLNHKAWLMNRIGKESWGLLTALQRGGQAPEAPGSNSRRPPQRSGFLRPAPRAFGSQAMWLEFPPLFFLNG